MSIPETYQKRPLNNSDRSELRWIKWHSMDSSQLRRLMRDVAKIRDALDGIAVRFNRHELAKLAEYDPRAAAEHDGTDIPPK